MKPCVKVVAGMAASLLLASSFSSGGDSGKGSGTVELYWRIILLLSRPVLAALFVLQLMALWNDLLWPLVISSTMEMRTLPAALTLFSSQSGVEHAALTAGAAISLTPLALAFVSAQRFFVQGVATTGLK